MDIKKTEKKNLSRTYRQSTANAKKNLSNNNNKETNINMTEIFYTKNNSQILTKETWKNNCLNTANKSKALSKKNLYKFFKNSKTEFPNYDINNILNKRQSYQIPKSKNTNLITHERLTLKKTFKKNKKDNNINNNKQIASRKDNKKNKSEIKDRKNEENRMSNISDNKKIKKENKENESNLRKTQIPHNKRIIYENLNIDDNIKETKDENEIINKVLRHNTTVFTFEKNNFLFDENKKEINNNDHDLDKFFRQNNNSSINNINNSELFRFSNISKINNNDLFYLNNNHIFNNFTDNKNNYFLNPKIETIEGNESHELFEFDDKLLEESIYHEEKQKEKINKIEQIVSMPCLNCNKLININEMDEHSNKCYKMKKNIDINENNKNTLLNIIENKLKNILEYLNKNDINKNTEELNGELKLIVENILFIKEINSFSIENLSKINNKINNLMENNLNNASYFTLLSRIKILLEEKIKYFSENNQKNKDVGSPSQNKNLEENSIEENISESETMEFFDLKKMEKILDEKKLNNQNLDKIINEAKNKRLFLMEVLKVKFQKIKENKNEDLISPEMIWKEALKKNIERNNWTQFIFNELNNPNKYLKMIQKKNNVHQKKK